MKKIIAACVLIAGLALTGCQSRADSIREKAEVVKACTDSGGEWYNTKGWGEGCNFDTRKEDAK